MIPEIIKGFLVLTFIFVPLELILPRHQQKSLRPGWQTDVLYYFTGYFIGKIGLAISTSIIILYLSKLINHDLQEFIASQPLFIQVIETIIVGEIGYYTAHRLSHTIPFLWQFHAIHHSVEYLDWLATVRVHPWDQIFTKICQIVPIYLLGFTPATLGIYTLFSAGIAFFIHSNIRCNFGWLNYLLVTPNLHHWHHSNDSQSYHKNFAAQLPLIDLIGGSFYLPNHRKPEKYGITEAIPNNYLGQLYYPFQSLAKKLPINHNLKQFLTSLLKTLGKFFLVITIISSLCGLPQIITQINLANLIASIGVEKITVAQLQTLNPNSVIIIDVRTPEEYKEKHIPDSISIPLSEIKSGVGITYLLNLGEERQNLQQKKPKIVFYCTSGKRAIQAYKYVEARGLNIAVLDGGMTAFNQNI